MNKIILALLLTAAGCTASAQSGIPQKRVKAVRQTERTSGTARITVPQSLPESEGTLAAGITCLNAGESATVVWSENFDSGCDGWELENAEKFSWELKKMEDKYTFTGIDPDDVQSLYINGSYRIYERGTAAAISPAVEIPKNATFGGHIGYSYNLSSGYCTMTVSVSENGNDWTPLWSNLDDSEVKSWIWHKFAVDMTAYAGKTVRFKFEYGNTQSYDNAGYLGDFAIDGLQLSAAAEAASIDVLTGETVKFADASSGNPTSWQWSFPGGTPSSSAEQYPQIYYTRDGTYDVSLTVGDGTNTSTKTLPGFVNVTGVKPTARIGLPATFHFSQTRLPMIAPLAPVQFTDASEGFPTTHEWTFTGADQADAGKLIPSAEENPEVSFWFQHKQTAFLEVGNGHGESAAMEDFSVEYEGFANNLQPDDELFTFELDGFGEFPGTNSLQITDYAERFSKPSRPVFVSGAVVYFTNATAEELIDQIADVKVALCKSEGGLPGEQIEFMSWRVFELETPSGFTLTGTDFQFSRPVLVNDEFFIVVSGIPQKSENCTVSFATAKFRGSGNTAYFKQRGEWKAASAYFPAGANHTSYAISPYIVHSVMMPLSGTPIEVGQDAGETTLQLFSYLGYKTPVACDAAWCRITSKPNGMTLDDIKIGYDELPAGTDSRTATFTFTDGASTVSVPLIQKRGSGIRAEKDCGLTVSPTAVHSMLSVALPDGCSTVEILTAAGNSVYKAATASTRMAIDASAFAPGIYIVKASDGSRIHTAKFIKQ